MLKLYQPPPGWGLPNISPACMKLETWLRLAGVPYEVGTFGTEAPPKGKVPFIRDGELLMGDSTLIIEHLKSTHGVDPDASLSAAERAASMALRRMVKEHLYWQVMFVRYLDPIGWQVYSRLVGPMLAPGGTQAQHDEAAGGLQKQMLSRLVSHGLGVHTPEEAHQLFIEDLRSISDFLGTKPFLFGDQPTTADATVYSHVANIIQTPLTSASTEFGRSRQNLVDYCDRMQQRFFPELARRS